MNPDRRYLVTGCAGFIGARVCQLLLDAGHSVVGVDDLNDAYDPRLKRWRLEGLVARDGFQFVEADVADEAAVERLFAGPSHTDGGVFAAVLNLAARAGVRQSIECPRVYLRTNAEGTLCLLEACRRHGVPKFVLASTSSLYAGVTRVPFEESDDTSRPLSPYAASKKAAETMAFTYHHLYGLDVSVLRYFTVYGPFGRPDMSVLRFIRNISLGEPIVVYGDGTQERDFTYVDDIAAGTIAALRPVGYEIINLGGSTKHRLNDLIDTIARRLGREPIIDRQPFHAADMPQTWANVEKAERLLGWTARVPLETGVAQTVAWFQAHRSRVLELVF